MVTCVATYDLKLGDAASLITSLPDASIDLVVTSPPYDGIREYKKRMAWDYFRKIASGLYRVTKKGGIVVWIVNDIADDKGSSLKQAMSFMSDGFLLHDTMIHKKPFPLISKVRYKQAFEYMFVFSKEKPATINLLHDKPKKARTKEAESDVRDNIWTYTSGNEITFSYLTAFPLALAMDQINSWSKENETVFDPFLRSGTTGVASMLLNRNFIGFEKEKKYFTIAEKRIANWENEAIAVDEPCFSDELYETWEM